MKQLPTILILFMCLLSSGYNRLYAQTPVPAGKVGGQHWTVTGSPYLVQGNLEVQYDSTLTIDPGVNVIFQGYYYLKMDHSRLLARGTPLDSIRFTVADTTGYYNRTFTGWNALWFYGDYYQDTSYLEFTIVEYGRANGSGIIKAQGGGIRVNACNKLKINYSTIRNNLAISSSIIENSATALGAGIWVMNSSVMISHCHIHHNECYGKCVDMGSCRGGGIYLESSQANVIHNEIYSNTLSGDAIYRTWSQGAGLFVLFCDPLIEKNNFHHNYAGKDFGEGGGIYLSNSAATISNNRFTENLAVYGGGGLYADYLYNIKITGNLFNHNTSFMSGGGIQFSSASVSVCIYLINNTFTGNMARKNGGGLYVDFAHLNVQNCIFRGNMGYEIPCQIGFGNSGTMDTIRYCNLEGGKDDLVVYDDPSSTYSFQGGYDHNSSIDPLFIDPVTGDFHLQAISPCVNRGNPDTTGLLIPLKDLDGNPRIEMDTVDMGVYEYSTNKPPSDLLLTTHVVRENEPAGFILGELSTLDPDTNEVFQYQFSSIEGNSFENNLFHLQGNLLSTAFSYNYEEDSLHMVCLSTTDSRGHTLNKIFTINVLDVNDPPVVIHPPADTVFPEGTSTVFGLPKDIFYDEDKGDSVNTQLYAADPAGLPDWFVFSNLSTTITLVNAEKTTFPIRILVRGCDNQGSCALEDFYLSVLPSSINNNPPLRLYPNPTSSSFTLNFNNISTGITRIIIFDNLGREVIDLTTDITLEKKVQLDMSSLAVGVYPVKVVSEGFVVVLRVVKE
ncbi:MAG: T9SS type A sorting domain-containing protein [Bacteroidetes bacterium]|nr:T9SS type A sorting domain-containing protein [Bacteroidota bacterium]